MGCFKHFEGLMTDNKTMSCLNCHETRPATPAELRLRGIKPKPDHASLLSYTG